MSQHLNRLEHIGIAVRSLAESIPIYERLLQIGCYKIEEIANQGVRTAFFECGGFKIELLEPVVPDSPLSTFLDKYGEGLHHIAFLVDNLDQSLREIRDRGVKLLDRSGRPGADGLSIAFLNPKFTGSVLVEICSRAE